MRISNQLYDILKYVALIALPAIQVFWLTIGKIWNLEYTVEIGATIGAIALLLGTLLGVSSYQHNLPNDMDVSDLTYIDDEEVEATEVEEDK